jgi:ADP-ribose pyrophosphatase YjhB (NUDIX family)
MTSHLEHIFLFQILLVSSSGHSDRWIIPGGKVEPNECPEKSAMREAMEEGGVVGKLGRYLGCFDNVERRHRTWVYVLRVSHLLVTFEAL